MILSRLRSRLAQEPRGDCDAAVSLVLVDRGQLHLVFTQKRKCPGYPWSGQVAFPGGRFEPSDGATLRTALRELDEELRIHPDRVETIGYLGRFQSRVVPVVVDAYVVLWDGNGLLEPAAEEIEWVAEIPISLFVEQYGRFLHPHGSLEAKDPHYMIGSRVMWGLTARILHQFLGVLSH